MSKFNADTLQDMFSKVESGEITKEEAASYHQKSTGSINNYFQAKKAYEKGREVCAQNISVKAFTPWAVKYGNKGEPIYKQDPHPERKHTKKEADQIKMDIPPDNAQPSEPEHRLNLAPKPVIDINVSELSAKDKKELAMYAIDQHYFFLKQLTGVI